MPQVQLPLNTCIVCHDQTGDIRLCLCNYFYCSSCVLTIFKDQITKKNNLFCIICKKSIAQRIKNNLKRSSNFVLKKFMFMLDKISLKIKIFIDIASILVTVLIFYFLFLFICLIINKTEKELNIQINFEGVVKFFFRAIGEILNEIRSEEDVKLILIIFASPFIALYCAAATIYACVLPLLTETMWFFIYIISHFIEI